MSGSPTRRERGPFRKPPRGRVAPAKPALERGLFMSGSRTRRERGPFRKPPRGGVAPAKPALERGGILSGSSVDDDVAMGVEVRGSARWYEGRCVVLVD